MSYLQLHREVSLQDDQSTTTLSSAIHANRHDIIQPYVASHASAWHCCRPGKLSLLLVCLARTYVMLRLQHPKQSLKASLKI